MKASLFILFSFEALLPISMMKKQHFHFF